MSLALIRRFFQERKVYRRVVEELSFMTYRELRELGLDRADIPRVAKEAARQS